MFLSQRVKEYQRDPFCLTSSQGEKEMKLNRSLFVLLTVLLAVGISYLFAVPLSATQGQKREGPSAHSSVVVGVIVESNMPQANEPRSADVTFRNVSQKEIGCIITVNPQGKTGTTYHYLDETPFSPNTSRTFTFPADHAEGLKIAAVVYLDGQIEGNAFGVKRAREIHDGYVAEINDVSEKLSREPVVTEPSEAIRKATHPTGAKVDLLGRAHAAFTMRMEVERSAPENRKNTLKHLMNRLERVKMKIKSTAETH